MEIELLKLYYQLLKHQLENINVLKDLLEDCSPEDDLKQAIDDNYDQVLTTQKELLFHFEDLLEGFISGDQDEILGLDKEKNHPGH